MMMGRGINSDVFLTTGNELLQEASQKDIMIKIRVANPLKWLTEVIESVRRSNEP